MQVGTLTADDIRAETHHQDIRRYHGPILGMASPVPDSVRDKSEDKEDGTQDSKNNGTSDDPRAPVGCKAAFQGGSRIGCLGSHWFDLAVCRARGSANKERDRGVKTARADLG